MYTRSCATEMLRYADLVLDRLDLRDLVQLQIGYIGAHPFYHEATLLSLKLIVAFVPVTRTVD